MMAARAPMVMVMIATMVAAPALPEPNEVRYRIRSRSDPYRTASDRAGTQRQ